MSEENEDFSIDSEDLDDSVVAEEHSGDLVKKLKEKLKQAEDKAREHLDGWQRAQADFVNIRKRDEEAKQEFTKFVSGEVIKDLIPVLDALTIGGNEPVYKLAMQSLKKHGLEESDPQGEMFDPKLHEAITTVKTDKEDEDGKILEVVQKGYILSGKIIRPAKVKVGEFNS